MAQVTIDIPNAQVTRVNDAFAAEYGYDASSGLTKTQFAKQQLIRFIKRTVIDYEGESEAKQARDTVSTDVDAINIT